MKIGDRIEIECIPSMYERRYEGKTAYKIEAVVTKIERDVITAIDYDKKEYYLARNQ